MQSFQANFFVDEIRDSKQGLGCDSTLPLDRPAHGGTLLFHIYRSKNTVYIPHANTVHVQSRIIGISGNSAGLRRDIVRYPRNGHCAKLAICCLLIFQTRRRSTMYETGEHQQDSRQGALEALKGEETFSEFGSRFWGFSIRL